MSHTYEDYVHSVEDTRCTLGPCPEPSCTYYGYVDSTLPSLCGAGTGFGPCLMPRDHFGPRSYHSHWHIPRVTVAACGDQTCVFYGSTNAALRAEICGASTAAGPCTFRTSGPISPPHRHQHSHRRKDTDMRDIASINREAESLRERLEYLEAQKEKVLALPKEPKRGTVIKFHLQYDPHGIVYDVVAFRSNRQGASWHTTLTRRPGPHTWEDLLEIMMSDYSVKTEARTLEFFEFTGKGTWVR